MKTPATANPPQGVEEVLGELDELAAHHERVCIGDVLDDFGRRSFGVFLLVPPLIELTPIGGLPGVPSFLALIVAITASQLLLGKDHIWLPAFVQERSVAGRRLHRALMKVRGVAHWLDAHSHGRLEALTAGIWLRMAALAALLLCFLVPPLELIPFASTLGLLPTAAIGLALLVRDGALMAFALALAAAGFGAASYLLGTAFTVLIA